MVPTVTVGILTFTLTPRGSRKALWRGIGLGRAGLKTWPAAIAIPFVLCAGAYGTAVALGVGRLDVDIANATPTWAIDLVLAAMIGTAFIVGEEIGWRGYLLPRMQVLTNDKRRAAVLTGFIHGCFHLPLILLATTYNTEGSRWVAAPVAVAVITAGGVFYAYIWDRAKTVWPVAIAHNTVNTVFELGSAAVIATGGTTVAYVAGETGFATLGVCVIAAVVLLKKAKVWQKPEAAQDEVVGQQPVPAVAA